MGQQNGGACLAHDPHTVRTDSVHACWPPGVVMVKSERNSKRGWGAFAGPHMSPSPICTCRTVATAAVLGFQDLPQRLCHLASTAHRPFQGGRVGATHVVATGPQ